MVPAAVAGVMGVTVKELAPIVVARVLFGGRSGGERLCAVNVTMPLL